MTLMRLLRGALPSAGGEVDAQRLAAFAMNAADLELLADASAIRKPFADSGWLKPARPIRICSNGKASWSANQFYVACFGIARVSSNPARMCGSGANAAAW